MELFKNCGDDYIRATSNRNWKTAGDDVQYELELKNDTLFVHYQCSTSKRDWINNFNFSPKRVRVTSSSLIKKSLLKTEYVWVHRGLWKAFISAWATIYQELLDVCKNNKVYEIVFDGHSYGGAMAQFSYFVAERRTLLYLECRTLMRMYAETWGAPKVFLRNKYYWVPGRIYQANNDLVPRMPPFYRRYNSVIKVGDKFNLFKMLKNMEHYHTSYDEYKDE